MAKFSLPAKDTTLYHVVEHYYKHRVEYWVVSEKVTGDYFWDGGKTKGFKTVSLPDYKNGIFPTPYFYRPRDLEKKVFADRTQAMKKADEMADKYDSVWSHIEKRSMRRPWMNGVNV